MPYDPDLDLRYGDLKGQKPPGHPNEMQEDKQEDEEGGDEGPYDDEPGEADEMEVDLVQPDSKQQPQTIPASSPMRRPPFPEARAVVRPTKLEVVLHSSPRRKSFTKVDDDRDLLNEAEQQPNSITSHLFLRRTAKHSGAKPSTAIPSVVSSPSEQQDATDTTKPLPQVTPQPKKRGRPFGWRPGCGPYSLMRAGLVAPTPPEPKPIKPKPTGQHKRKRPGRKPALTARQVYLSLNPHFPKFRFTPSIEEQEIENEDDRKKRAARVNRILAQRDRNAPVEPDYTVKQLEEMARVMMEKKTRQKMLRDYVDRVCGASADERWKAWDWTKFASWNGNGTEKETGNSNGNGTAS
ncbi:uncharacterized protein CTHT_0005660 [Thermochaetoides thermophila DSM 1495]|uniref:Uncharacterized protein n=1 Tax=Chaetomium thermophilum (strain DSM 1495 / CBS 144.50 / IMI 039719) TaxID=759272 RepID=G0RY72_CHATD|nr:hypothetical protein CTHT_0005660 [Thermochaetoides thermophila DSM 1495]EGS23858.1 hypothetical protein CTHT_0005660 [Thermochaetoides thermophila DSM 1495]